MNISTENISALLQKVIVEVAPTDYLPKVDEGIKALGKKANIPGFRAGKIPAGYLKNLYGNDVLADELNRLVSESLDNHINSSKLKIFGQPLPYIIDQNRIDIKNPQTYKFGFEIGLIPEIDVDSVLTSHNFTMEIPAVEDKTVGEEIEKIQVRYGVVTHPEALADDDTFFGEWEEMDGDNTKENGVKASSGVALKSVKDDATRKNIQALKEGESIVVDINKTFGNDSELIIHHILNTDHHTAEHMGSIFRMTVKSLNHVDKAELNQELFDKLFGNGNIKNEDELRARLKTELENEFRRIAEGRLMHNVRDYLTEHVKMELPVEFIEKLVRYNLKEEMSDEQLKGEMEYLLKQTRWDLISDKLTFDAGITINENDIREKIKQELRSQYFGGAVEEDEKMANSLNGIADYFLKDEKNKKRYAELALNEKLTELLKSKIKTEEKQVSEHDFFHHEHAHAHAH